MVVAVAISKLRIANMGLSNIGAAHIESLTEGSSESKQVDIWYEFSLLQSLEASDWNFARRRVELTTHGDAISSTALDPWAGVWGYRYVYPGDCVAMRKIQNPNAPPDDATPFAVETTPDGTEKTILTDVQEAVGVYTYMNKDPGMYSPYFVQMLSHVLASNMAMSLTGSQDIKNYHAQVAVTLGNLAASQNLNEGMQAPPRDADWIRGRSGAYTSANNPAWRALPDGSN
jgi:hypothetical protein